MSELTTEQFLEVLQRSGGSTKLDLSGHDLTGINLSGETLEELLDEFGYDGNGRRPPWFEPWTKGISLTRANLRETQFRMADLRNACMEGADLRSADLSGAFLQDATLEEADLRKVNLAGAVLSHTILWAKFPSLEGAYLYGTQIEFTPCTREQFGKGVGEERDRDWLRAREAYLALRHNFLDLGRYTDASWAYRKERRMERAVAFPSEEGDRWVKDEIPPLRAKGSRLPDRLLQSLLYLRLFIKPPRGVPLKRAEFVGNLLQDLACEYGENSWRLLWWGLGTVFFFAVGFFFLDVLAPAPVSLAFTVGSPQPPWDYLTFSFASLSSMNFVRYEPASGLGAFLSSLEAAIGMGLLALFMYTLGRRMSGS